MLINSSIYTLSFVRLILFILSINNLNILDNHVFDLMHAIR